MERIQGNGLLVECINPRLRRYIVRWDVKPYVDEKTGAQGLDYYEQWVNHKPTMSEIKKIVTDGFNVLIDQQIQSGFRWNGLGVWLSRENQFNYKAAYDLAIQTDGGNLPTTFKFGTNEEPQYYTFHSVDDLANFYLSAMRYINAVLNEGWRKKDAIDWSEYERLLDI